MSARGEQIVARARVCVGAPFRAQGRSERTGLDCLGLALIAIGPGVRPVDPPHHYSLNAPGLADWLDAGMATAGATRVERAAPGDIILFEPAPGHAHLAVASEHGVIQAHLGLRHVVEGPPDPAWPVRSVWRFEERL